MVCAVQGYARHGVFGATRKFTRPLCGYGGAGTRRLEREGFCLYTVLANGEVAGFTGAHRWLNDWGPAGEIELAWRLGCALWGEGIATRAAQQVMGELADAGHQQVYAVIHARNRASAAVAQRLGMHQRSNYEARLKGLNLPITEWVTDLYYREQNPSQHRYNGDSS